MKYNIDKWMTKKLDDFNVPLKAFFEFEQECFILNKNVILNVSTMEIQLNHLYLVIRGVLKGETLNIKEIEVSKEVADRTDILTLDKAFRQSKGELNAILVYKNTISKLIVKDGEITETELNLIDFK